MSRISKYVGWEWPPREWWLGGHWTQNHPVSHLLGGAAIVMLLWAFERLHGVQLSSGVKLFDIAVIAAAHEYLQIEFSGPDYGNARYPMYSAIGDVLFVIAGAVMFLGVIGG